METAIINSMSKEEWNELNVTNAEGRKAHVTLTLQDFHEDVIEIEREIRVNEAHAEILRRKINYLMACFEKENHKCNCGCDEEVCC